MNFVVRLFLSGALALPFLVSGQPIPGQPMPPWQEGMLDIHQINNGGSGDAAFFIFPDGTTFLLDAGACIRERPPRYDAPPRPNGSLRPGQWIARYIRRTHSLGVKGTLDYAAITHFHGDHLGDMADHLPISASGAYRLNGITDVAEEVPIRRMLDRGWPNYDFPVPLMDPMVQNYRKFLDWQIVHRGMRVDRFRPGRKDQIVLQHQRQKYPQFEIRNLAANGYVWTGSGESTRNRFPAGQIPSENNCSIAFRLSYGAFTYFNGGDMTGIRPNQPEWDAMESAVAWVTGPVDAYALNHHGSPDSANAFFLSVLQPRVHILSNYCASQPAPDVMRRLLSTKTYPGPRDIFMTNGIWPGRRENMVPLFGEADTAWVLERMAEAAGARGHVVLRVDPGGATYRVIMLEDSTEHGSVLSIHGPYRSRGASAHASAR